GGRLSLIDSVLVVVQNLISNGCGASVGMEAGYTQISAALASRLGVSFQMRRADLRTLVGCGSAAGIAAAFDAPLTGAFYAFELTTLFRSLPCLGARRLASFGSTCGTRLFVGGRGAWPPAGLAGCTRRGCGSGFRIGLACAA